MTGFAWNGASLAGGASFGAAGLSPAKYSFSTTAAGNCSTAAQPDYVVYSTGMAGTSGSQANIIAYDNIYSGCTGVAPLVYWSYYTGTGTVATSPVLSLDGTKVAFIENTGTGAVLRILKFASGEGSDSTSPVAPAHTAYTSWSSCTSGSCMISVPFANVAGDTTSSPYYDYQNDAIYVGDSIGYLHKFSPVFSGTPAELKGGGTTSGWPQEISASNPLASPIYDPNFQCSKTNCSGGTVFVSPTGSGTGQNFHNIAGVGGSLNITNTGTLFSATSTGSVDSPILDSSAGMVYLFVNNDTGGHAGVYQLPESLASNTEATVGTGSDTGSLYSGAFDNAYYTSTSSTQPIGHIWVCGNSGGNPALYPILINGASGMTTGAITAGPTVSGTASACSPVTEFCVNGGANCTASAGTDYLFVGTATQPASGQVTGCTASEGCIQSYTLNTSGSTATLKSAGPAPGGTAELASIRKTPPSAVRLRSTGLICMEIPARAMALSEPLPADALSRHLKSRHNQIRAALAGHGPARHIPARSKIPIVPRTMGISSPFAR